MKNTVNTNAHKANIKSWKYFFLPLMLVGVVGCGEVDEDDGDIISTVPLPTDTSLNLYCENVGVGAESCILDDPANPYARTPFTLEQLFEELDEDAPGPKARFYLWGTAQARSPQGVYQFFTALNLHYLYGASGSELIREQTLKAYRALLDNYFDSAWFLKVETPDGDILFPRKLKDAVGLNIFDPTDPDVLETGLVPLFATTLLAEQAIGEWGYAFNIDNKIMEALE
ncbi:MAG: hypothetical protein QNJ69_01220 [Gammaproteobacteria bacterium]|nr:hypothetical protein [Gammaproteobacteria bacterium]